MISLKQKLLTVVVVVITVVSCYSFSAKQAEEKKDKPGAKGFAVVELFTSEGCSSCPSADALVGRILSENKKDVYILSFHVDYWNRLGWKDEFSSAAYSDRQKLYARHLALEGIYTPQIVVNGSNEFVGSNETKLRNTINAANKESHLAIEAVRSGNSAVTVSYNIEANKGDLLNIALVQPEAVTQVKRGENSGRELHHVNVVRQFVTVQTTAGKGTAEVQIPAELAHQPFKLIAYTQQKDDFKISGAAEASIAVSTGSN